MMGIPPDFHIEYAVCNMHVWMILRRLQQIPGKEAELMAQCLKGAFDQYNLSEVGKIHLKKKGDFIKDLTFFSELNIQAFERHFFSVPKTSQNPYYKIDSLLWSTVFFEKVERYSDQVYLMSEYLIKHFQYIQSLSMEDLGRAQLDFDVYRISIDYKSKIQEVNPPLTEEEFEAELNNSNKIKSFFYNYDDPNYVMPLEAELTNTINRRLDTLKFKFVEKLRKFESPDTYDLYSEREERDEEKKKKTAKYAWKSRDDWELRQWVGQADKKANPTLVK